jgi:hypothetical protein
MSTHLLVVLSVVLAVIAIAVLASALIVIRRGLRSTAATLSTLAGALEMVQTEHLHGLHGSVEAINGQFDTILSALPGIADKAAIVAERRPR